MVVDYSSEAMSSIEHKEGLEMYGMLDETMWSELFYTIHGSIYSGRKHLVYV